MRSACRSISTTPSCTLVTAEHRRHFWLKSWACPRLGGRGHSKWSRPTTVQTSISWMPTAKSRRSIMPFSSANQSSTEYLIGSANDRFRTGPTLPKVKRVRSIITTAGAVSISKIPTAIFWRSSRALTVAAVGILDHHREPRWWIIFVIAVALHDRLAVAAIRTSCGASIERQLLACECTLNKRSPTTALRRWRRRPILTAKLGQLYFGRRGTRRMPHNRSGSPSRVTVLRRDT